jgi:hypothetical protein
MFVLDLCFGGQLLGVESLGLCAAQISAVLTSQKQQQQLLGKKPAGECEKKKKKLQVAAVAAAWKAVQ